MEEQESKLNRSSEALTNRTFHTVRNRAGAIADTLEGIASLGRSRVAGIPGVGRAAMEEIDEVLSARGIAWGGGFTPASGMPPAPRGVRDSAVGRRSNAIEILIDSAHARQPRRVEALVRNLAKDLEIEGVEARRAEALVARLAHGETLDAIANRIGVTRERIRQITKPLSDEDVRSIRRMLAKAITYEQRDLLVAQFREGQTEATLADELACSPPAAALGLRAPQLKVQIKALMSRRDRTIHEVMATDRRREGVRLFSDIEILDAVRRVSREYCSGEPPTVSRYEDARRSERSDDGTCRLPSVPLVSSRFGYWSKAIQSAGFDVKVRGPRVDREWTTEACLEAMLDLVRELEVLPSVTEYDKIAAARKEDRLLPQLPSSSTAMNRLEDEGLGRWEALRAHLVQRLVVTGEW